MRELSKLPDDCSKLLGDTFESMIGALYLQLGYDETHKAVINKM